MASLLLLEHFPVEILDHVLNYVPRESLANIRLASGLFERRATPFLYKQITLRNPAASAAKVTNITKRHSLACLVREFRFDVSICASVR